MAKSKRPILTDWEAKLMSIIWQKGSACSDDIREALREEGIKRSDSAIRKTLRVMEEKGALSHTIENRTYIYHPLMKQHKVQGDVIRYLSALFFHGSIGSMALRALDEADLSPDVILEMRKKLDEAEKDGRC